ncbi:MAG: sugar ABC transporter permease [Oscillospiraceae bacterium]
MEQNNRKSLLCGFSSAVYMGIGQIINKQYLKGIIYIAIETLLLLFVVPYLYWGVEGLITLGSVPKADHSLFLMTYGILAIIALCYLIVFYISCIKDAYRNSCFLKSGVELPTFKASFKLFLERKAHLLFVAPGVIAVSLVVVLPLVFSIMIGFTNYDVYHQPPSKLLEWVGIQNFIDIFTIESWSYTFKNILWWTLEWTVLSSVLPYVVGIFIAVLLNNPRVKGKRLIRTAFILPWAIPSYISILVWKGMFDTNDGIINHFLTTWFNIDGIQWMQNTTTARIALMIVAVWCGFTFPMMISDSVMKSIPAEVYEAAKLDGASSTKCFFKITFPLLMFSIAPLFIMGLAGAFNNFNMIYLFSAGGPPNLDFMGAGNTDILISWLFNMTFNTMKYNYASAISLIIFFVLAAFSGYNLKKTKNFTEEDMMQ